MLWLELDLSSKLDDSLCVSEGRRRDLTEGRRGGDGRRGTAEDRVIEDVECFNIDLESDALFDWKQPMDGCVEIPEVLGLHEVARRVA